MPYTDLIALTTQADTLIRAEVRASKERGLLEDAVRQALSLGYEPNEISASTGLTVDEIRRIGETPRDLADLGVLAGMA